MRYLLRVALAVLPGALVPAVVETLLHFVIGVKVRLSMNCDTAEIPLVAEEPEVLSALAMMHVVYATDGQDLWGLIISMKSLAHHVSDPGNVTIHIISSELARPHLDHLVRCFKKEMAWLPAVPKVSVVLERPCNLSEAVVAGGFHGETCSLRFVRFCLQDYLPTAARAIWIDTDVAFRDDVRKLYQMRMRFPVAATLYTPYTNLREHFWQVSRYGPLPVQARSRHLDPYYDYPHMNAGIMVVDLLKWRPGSITRALIRWMHALGEKLCLNQLALNIFFRNGFDKFDWRWNVMVPRRVGLPPKCKDEAHAFHWAGPLKPWRAVGWWMHEEVLLPYVPKNCSESEEAANQPQGQ